MAGIRQWGHMDWSLLGQLSVSVITGSVAAFIAARLALKRFYQERWWEKKLAGYVDPVANKSRVMRRFEQLRLTFGQVHRRCNEARTKISDPSVGSNNLFNGHFQWASRVLRLSSVLAKRKILHQL